jgi:hypothetical protein
VAQLLTCSIDAGSSSLIGYWTLDNVLTDASASANDATAVNTVPFVQTVDADVCYGSNQYCYAQFSSAGGGTSDGITRGQPFIVTAGTPALLVSLTTSYVDFTAPAGVTLNVVDPNGNAYGTATDTHGVFVQLTGGVPTLIAVIQPIAGPWTVTVTAPGTAAFVLAFQTFPSATLPGTIQATLQPVYGGASRASNGQALGLSLPGWVTVAAATVGAALAVAAVAVSAPVAIVAALVTVTAAAAPTVVSLARNLSSASHREMVSVAATGMQLDRFSTAMILADAAYDGATKSLWSARLQLTYTYAMTVWHERIDVYAAEFTNANMVASLQEPGVVFISAASHGRPAYLQGYRNPLSAPDEKVLLPDTYPAAAAKGIIFHFCACHTGVSCGPALVAAGASAFLGYTERFQFSILNDVEMIRPDSMIDFTLLSAKTAGEAQDAAVAAYERAVDTFKRSGMVHEAAMLEWDRDHLVGPRTSSAYGNVEAVIGGG